MRGDEYDRPGVTTDEPFIHETAILEDGVQIGAGTRVWHFCHVRAGASIGSDCNLGKGVYVDAGVVIGNGVKVQNHVSLFTGVTLGDQVMVGPSAVFTNDLRPRASDDWTITPTVVGEGVGIGANATIVCGSTLGEWAMVGAGTVVVGDVPAYGLVVGNPSRLIGWVNKQGDVVSRDELCPEGIENL